MSRNTGTKTKKCLVFQFYRIDNVYYFRFIKLIVCLIREKVVTFRVSGSAFIPL